MRPLRVGLLAALAASSVSLATSHDSGGWQQQQQQQQQVIDSGWRNVPVSFSWRRGTHQPATHDGAAQLGGWINSGPTAYSGAIRYGTSPQRSAGVSGKSFRDVGWQSAGVNSIPAGGAWNEPGGGAGGWRGPSAPEGGATGWRGPSAPVKIAASGHGYGGDGGSGYGHGRKGVAGYAVTWIAPPAQGGPAPISYGGGGRGGGAVGRPWQDVETGGWTSVPVGVKSGLALRDGAAGAFASTADDDDGAAAAAAAIPATDRSPQDGRWVREDGRWVWEVRQPVVRGAPWAATGAPTLGRNSLPAGWQWAPGVTEALKDNSDDDDGDDGNAHEEIRVGGGESPLRSAVARGRAVSWSWSRRGY